MALAAALDVVVERNGELTALDFAASMSKVLRKICDNPTDAKFRQLNAKAKLVERLVGTDGGLAVLLACGFRRRTVSAPAPAFVQSPNAGRTMADALVDSHVDSLVAMGFKRSSARVAIKDSGGDVDAACAGLVEVGFDARGCDDESANAAPAPAPAPQGAVMDAFVLEASDATAIEAVLRVLDVDLPALIARRKAELTARAKADAARVAKVRADERGVATARWREDEADRADRRARQATLKDAPTPTPTPPKRTDETSMLIDAQDAEYAASTAVDTANGLTAGDAVMAEAPPLKRHAAPRVADEARQRLAVIDVAVRTPGQPAVRRQFLASWTLAQLLHHLGQGTSLEIVAPDSATGRRRKLDVDAQAASTIGGDLQLHGATIDVSESRPPPTPAPQPRAQTPLTPPAPTAGGALFRPPELPPAPFAGEILSPDEAYRKALNSEGRVRTVAPVEFLDGEADDSTLFPGLKQLILELGALPALLGAPTVATAAFLRFKTRDARKMRALVTGPAGTPYEGGTFEFTLTIPQGYPREPPRVALDCGSAPLAAELDGLVSSLASLPVVSLLCVLEAIQGRVLKSAGGTDDGALALETLREMARALRRPAAVFGTIVRLHYTSRRGAIAAAAQERRAAAQGRGDEAMAEAFSDALVDFDQALNEVVEAARAALSAATPAAFVCSITHEVMRDPCFADDGHTYERCAIQRWFETNRKSPRTGERLPSARLVPNHTCRAQISEWREAHSLPALPPWAPPPRHAPARDDDDDDDEDDDDDDDDDEPMQHAGRRFAVPSRPRAFPGSGLRVNDGDEAARLADGAAADAAEGDRAAGAAARAAERRATVVQQRQAFMNRLEEDPPQE